MDSSNQLTIFDQCIDALDIYSYAVMRFYISPNGSTSKTIVVPDLTYEVALASIKKYQYHNVKRDKESGSYFYIVKYLKEVREESYGIGGPYDGIEVSI